MAPRYSRTTRNIAAQPASSAYPKGSPARKIVKTSSSTPSVMGFSRQVTNVTSNGVPVSSTSTVSSSGGGGGLLGPILILGGVFMLWIVFRGKSGAMWNAITGNSGFDAKLDDFARSIGPLQGTGSGSSNKTSAPVTGNTSDSGTHMGIDSNGNIITINSSYGNMTPEQKDAANAYAHQIGNI